MTYRHGTFTWYELVTTDIARAKGFYGELFGWKVEALNMGPGMTYDLVKLGEASIAGFTPPQMEGVPPHWLPYISVADVDASAKAIRKNGGTTLSDAVDIPTVGRIQVARDPQGAIFALFHGSDGDTEFPKTAGSWYWNELHSADPAASVAFYEKTFGLTHDTMKMPNGEYHTLKVGDALVGGVMKSLAPKAPTQWMPYVRVDDPAATCARAKKLGGTVFSEPEEIEGVGRFAVVADLQGVALGIIRPA
jgi:uncharacterized protein